jgi:(S)-2-hydroxy-acid oxidase
MCLGADFVLVGRPALWGLAYKGQEGVEVSMNILEREFSRAMALVGATSVKGFGPHFLTRKKDLVEMAKL